MSQETSPSRYAVPRSRRIYSAQFKAELIAACLQPGTSIAATAREHGMNANVLHRWLKEHRLGRHQIDCDMAAPVACDIAAHCDDALTYICHALPPTIGCYWPSQLKNLLSPLDFANSPNQQVSQWQIPAAAVHGAGQTGHHHRNVHFVKRPLQAGCCPPVVPRCSCLEAFSYKEMPTSHLR